MAEGGFDDLDMKDLGREYPEYDNYDEQELNNEYDRFNKH